MLHVITQYCNDPRPARQAEYDFCMRRNLENRWVAKVHNLVEPGVVVPPDIAAHPKYVEAPTPAWLTYRAAIDYANGALAGQVVALCNLDIFLDEASDWSAVAGHLDQKRLLCLSRHEFDGQKVWADPGLAKLVFAHTQDAWVFRAPVEIVDCAFEMGMPGCDNAFADRVRRSGFAPYNAAQRFRILHFDQARGKTAENFLAVHKTETSTRPPNRHPEDQGQFLVPDVDGVTSLDRYFDMMGIPDSLRYQIACDVASARFKIQLPR